MSEQNLKATVVYNPFDLSDRTDALLAFETGKSLDAYLEGLPENVTWSVALNGREIDMRMAHMVFPAPDDHLLVMPTPEGGGGGDGKAILAMVATITLSIFAPQLAPTLLQGLGVTATTTAINVAAAAISITGGLLINAFLPAPSAAENEQSAATYGIDGPKNVSTENIPVPVLYGRHAFGGNYLDIYTENDTDASGNSIQYLYARTLISEGPIAAIEEDTIQLNGQSIDTYDNVEIDYSLGTDSPAPAPWFNAVRNMVNQGVAIKEREVRSYTTSGDVEGFRLDVVAPGGLFKRDSDGDLHGRDVTLQIRYRAEGETEWRNLRTVGGWGAASAAVTAAKVTFATRDRFKVTARLVTDLSAESLIGSTLQYRVAGSAAAWRELPMDAEEALLGSRRVVLRAEEIVPEMGNPTANTNFELRILDPQGAVINLSAGGQSIEISTPTSQGTNCHFGDKKTTAVRRSFTSPKLPRATYEIEYTREDYDGEGYDGGSTIMGQAQCSDIAEITYEDLRLPHSAWLGIKVRLDDQLNSIPTLTGVAKGIEMPIYDHEGKQVDYAWSDNPADISLDAYLNRRYGGSVDPEQINWADYADWRDHCVDNDLIFNGLFYESSDIDAAQKHIYTAGRAQRVVSGTTLGVTVERDSMPVMTFGDGNIQTGTLEVGYIGFTDRINDLAITFTNEEDDFAKDTMRFTNDAALNRGDPLKSTNIELKGITKSDRIAREGKLRMNMNRLIRRTANWYAPIEGIGCTVGNVVNLQTRMLDWAEGGRLRSGSAGRVAILDKPFTFEAGESYQLLVHRATKKVGTAEVISQAGNLLALDIAIPVTTNVKRIVVGSTEYAVTRIMRYESSTDVLLGSDVSTLNLTGLSAALWDTDVLETLDVDTTMTTGTVETVHLNAALPGDAVYSNYMLGKTSAKKRLFRIKSLGRATSDGYIKLTAVEHVPEVYEDNAEIVLQPRPVAENHVTNLAASVRAERGAGAMKLMLDVSWSTLGITYTGARVDVSVDQGRFETFTTTAGNSVEIPVEKGHTYTVRVTALQAGAGVPPVAQVSTVGYASRPGAPEGLTVTPGFRSLELGWTKSAIGSTVSYEIVWTQDPNLALDAATEVMATSVSPEYTISGMGDFSDHYVAVRAIDAYNNRSDWTALESGAPKETLETGDVAGIPDVPAATPAPTGLTLSTELVSDGVSSVAVTWEAPVGVEPVGYELRMRVGGGNYSSIQTSELSYELRAQPGTAMTFSVRAIYAYSATSDYTAEQSITAAKDATPPAAPTGLKAKDGVGSIWLIWDANTEIDLSHYEVAEKVSTSTPAVNTTAILTTTTSTQLAHRLDKGLTRHYWIRAVDTSGNKSDWSAMVTAKSIDVSEEIQKSLDDATWTADVGFVKYVSGATLPTTNVGETISFGGKLYTWDGTAYAPTVKMDELTFENVTGSVSKGQLGTDVSDFIEQQGVTAGADKDAAEQAAADALAAADAAAGAQEISESARNTSVAAKDLAETAKGAAEQAQADAEAAQSGAVSAKSAAETARDAAQTARDLAQTARGGAETAQGASESAQGLAEQARDAAQSAQTGAAASEKSAIEASVAAQSNAGRNYIPIGLFEHAPTNEFRNYFNSAYVVDAPAGHPLNRTRALRQQGRDANCYPSTFDQHVRTSTAGRRYRFTGYIYNASEVPAQAGLAGVTPTGVSRWIGAQVAPANSNEWVPFSVELTAEGANELEFWRPWLQINGTNGAVHMETYWTDLRFEDITESHTAEQAAAAAVTSESNAAASADEAGEKAIAADEARVAAQTAQSNAETAETNAASSETNAAGSASEAATSSIVAATAQRRAEEGAVGTLIRDGSFEEGDLKHWTYLTSGVSMSLYDHGATVPRADYSLRITRTALTGSSPSYVRHPAGENLQKLSGRALRFRGTVFNYATGAAFVGVRRVNDDDTLFDYQVAQVRGAGASSNWAPFDVVIEVPDDGKRIDSILIGADLINVGDVANFTDLVVNDVTESEKATDAAAAAAISESNAAASATEAGEEAASATIAKNLAETAQGYAEAAEERAATSETNAAGSESAAAASETVAANASREASQSAGANLLPFSTVEVADVKYGDYLAGNIFVTDDIPAGHPLGRTKAIKQTNRPGYIAMSQEDAWVQSSLGGRIFKISGYVYNASTAQARMGMHYKRADNTSSWPTGDSPAAQPGTSEWTYFEHDVEFGEGHDSVRWQGWIHINGQSGTDTFEAYWTDLRIEDVTEQRRATQSASAAATSESNAAASATEAGEQASAAQTARTGAETARSGAETAQTNASQSATDADGSASSAASSASAAADSANEAGDSASAASESASLASTKATEAGTQADAAQTARTAAETARSGAETAESNAASSATDAAGSASEASSSKTVAASLSKAAATRNLWPQGTFLDNNRFGWNRGEIVTDPITGSGLVLKNTGGGGDIPPPGSYNVSGDPRGRSFRVRGKVYNPGANSANIWIRRYRPDGSNIGQNNLRTVSSGGGTDWVEFDEEVSISINDAPGEVIAEYHFFLQHKDGTSADREQTYWKELSVEDITESTKSALSAEAAATSETNASASENAAGQFADAAEIAKTGAETARSGAETAETNAAQSETTATGAASSAVSSASLAAKASSRALERAVGNLIADGNFVQSTLEWANFTTGLLVTRYDHTGTQPDTDFSMSLKAGVAGLGMGYARQAPSEVLKTMRGRTLRITGWGNTANAGKGVFGFRTINDDNSLKSYVTVELMPARQNWTWVDQLIELPDNYAEVHSILLGAEFTDLNDVAYFTQLTLEDVTESQSAADSAAASADSATTAAASADEAGQSASAADTARLAAETAQGFAEAAEGRAATSENNADMSASEASGYSTLAATAQSRAASVNMGRGIVGPQIVAFSDNYAITAYQDGTEVYRNGVLRHTLDRGQLLISNWYDAGDVITASGPVAMNNAKSISPVPAAFAGDKFYTYWNRNTPITIHVVPLASGKYRFAGAPAGAEPYPLLASQAWADMEEGVPFSFTVGDTYSTGQMMMETTAPVVVARTSSGGDYDTILPMWPEILYNGGQSYRAFGNGGVKVNDPMMTGMTPGEPVMAVGIGDGAGTDCEHAMPVAMAGDTYIIPEDFIDDYWIAATEETVVRITDKDGLLRGEHTIGSGKQPGAYQYGSRSGSTTTQITNGPFFVTGDKPFALRTNNGADREYMVLGFRRAFLGTDSSAQVNAAISYAAQASAYSDEAGDQASAAEASRLAAETAWGGAELAESNAATSESNAAGSASSASTSQAITARARAQAQVQAGGNLMPISTFEDAGIDYSVWLPSIMSVTNAPAGHPLGRKKAIHQTDRSGYMPMLEDGYYVTEQLEGRTFKISGWIYNDGNVSAGAGVTYRTASDGSNRWRTVTAAPANSNEWVFYEDTLTFEDGLDQRDWRGWLFLNGWSSDGDNMSAYWTDIRIEDVTESVAAETAASAAATSESNASASETAAGEAAEAADASALAAGTSASNALASEGRTATSETNAAGSASAASESATLAADAADAAGGSAEAAALSESNASSSATDSANSADASASSALVATSAKDKTVQLVGNPVFEFEGEGFASYSGWNPSGTHTDFTYGDEIADPATGGRAYNFGFGTIQFLEPVPFDPARTYRMKARVRANTADCTVHFGFMRFDANGAEVPAGSNRYWHWSGSRVSQGDWVEYVFEFGADATAVAASTALIRPVLLMNYQKSGQSLDVDEFRLEDVTERTEAAGHASAAATSASEASGYSSDAYDYAQAANQSKLDAETAHGNAVNVYNDTVEVYEDADAAASSATSSATLAARSSWKAAAAASGNLIWKSTYEDGTKGGWTGGQVVDAPAGHPLGRTKAVKISTRDTYHWVDPEKLSGETFFTSDLKERTLRFSGWVYNLSVVQARAGINYRRESGSNNWPTKICAGENSGEWVFYDFTLEFTENYDGVKWRPFFQLNGTTGSDYMETYWTDVSIEDVTESQKAADSAADASSFADSAAQSKADADGAASLATQQAGLAADAVTDAGDFASAASLSADQASASADAAGQSASSASENAQTATTQAGYALSRAGAAADSVTAASDFADDAAGYANAAAISESNASNYRNLAALAMSGGGAKNPVFVKWGDNYPLYVDSYLQNGSIVQASGKYGNAVDLISPNNTALGPYLGIDRHNTFTPFTLAPKVLVTVEVELLSGNPDGASIDFGWFNGTGWVWEQRHIGGNLILGAGVQVFQFYIERPSSFVNGTDVMARLFSSRNAAGGSLQVVSLRVHRFDWQVVAAESLISEQMTTKATVDGIAEAAYVMRLKAGGASAGFEMVAANNPNGPASSIRMSADEIILDGTVKTGHLGAAAVTADKMAIGDFENLLGGNDFEAFWDLDTSNATPFTPTYEPMGRALQLTGGGTGINPLRNIPVMPREKFHMSLWAFQSSNWNGNPGTTKLRVGLPNGGYVTAIPLAGIATGWTYYSAEFTVPDGANELRITLGNNATAGTLNVAKLMLRRKAAGGVLIEDGTITASQMIQTEAVLTNSAQIANAIIDDAHITELSAAKLIAGTAIAGNIIVAGQTAANLATWAHNPASRINAGPSTNINPGKITISGGTTLQDWRGTSDTTSINGGKIETGSVTTDQLAVGFGKNLLHNTDFWDGYTGWRTVGSGGIMSQTGFKIRPAGSDWASGASPTLQMHQTGTATDGYTDVISRGIINGDEALAPGTPIQSNQYYEVSVHLSMHRCVGQLRIQWLDIDGATIAYSGPVGVPTLSGASKDPDGWQRIVCRGKAPASAVYANIHIRKLGTLSGSSDSHMFIYKPMLAQTVPNASEITPYSMGDFTFISGGRLLTQSITAEKVASDAIIARHILADQIDASHLNTANLAVHGLAIFGGRVQSDNYVPFASGWAINKDGSAQFNNLIVRGSLQVGSVSDGGYYAGTEGSSQYGNGDTVFTTPVIVGPFTFADLWQLALSANLRVSNTNGGENRLYVEARQYINGGWTGWSIVPGSPSVYRLTPDSNEWADVRAFGFAQFECSQIQFRITQRLDGSNRTSVGRPRFSARAIQR